MSTDVDSRERGNMTENVEQFGIRQICFLDVRRPGWNRNAEYFDMSIYHLK